MGLNINITNFRCYKDRSFHFNLKTTLINGVNGSGKSTLFQAIQWCLYGKVQKITPIDMQDDKKKIRTKVEIKYDDWGTIIRQNNPNVVSYTDMNDVTINGDIAQDAINRKFGEMSQWLITSYVNQEDISLFLRSSNAAKMDFLLSIAFGDSNPEYYINRIWSEYKDVESKAKDDIDRMKARISAYKKKVSEKGFTMSKVKGDMIDISRLRRKRKKINVMLQEMYEIRERRRALLIERKKLQHRQKELTRNIEKIEKIVESIGSIEDIDRKYNDYSNRLHIIDNATKRQQLQHEYDLLKTTIDELTSEVEMITTSSVDGNIGRIKSDLESNINYRNQQSHEHRRLGSHDVGFPPYDEHWDESKRRLLSEFQTMQQNVECSRIYQRFVEANRLHQSTVQTINSEYNNAHNYANNEYERSQKQRQEYDHWFNEQMSTLRSQEDRLRSDLNREIDIQRTLSFHSCPKCKTRLEYKNNQLVEVDVVPTVTNDEIVGTIDDSRRRQRELEATLSRVRSDMQRLNVQDPPSVFDRDRYVRDLDMKTKHRRESNDNNHNRGIEDIRSEWRRVSSNILITGTKIEPIDMKRFHYLKSIVSGIDRIRWVPHLSNDFNDDEMIKRVRNEYSRRRLRSDIESNNQSLQRIQTEIEKIEVSDVESKERDNIVNHIKTLKQKQKDYIESTTKLVIYKDDLVKVEGDLDTIMPDDNSEQIDGYSNDLNEINNQIDDAIVLKSLREDYDVLIKDRDDALKMERRMIALGNLHQIAVDVEHDLLRSLTLRITSAVNSIVDMIYSEPMTIDIRTFCELKTTKRRKPNVNMVIYYKGGIMNINQISGGERKRLSMAISIALNNLSGSPIMILDEILANVDIEARERCLNILNSHSSDKFVLCAEQAACNGHYENTYDL